MQTAEDLVRKEFTQHYEGDNIQGDQHDHATTDFSDFGDISVATDSSNELDRFLREKAEKVKDPLEWWYKNRTVYPKLSRMALDFLCIPPTSTAVERVFSTPSPFHSKWPICGLYEESPVSRILGTF